MHELTEKTLAHYTIQRRLAHGGMSEVFLAYDEKRQCNVAIKVVNRREEDHFVHFQCEVKALSTLLHPHILPILEYGEHGPWHYCVMPYIQHGTLRERIKEKSFTPEEAGEILEQIASALQFAHEHGILHRDIKPANILLKNEHSIYLADFGLAKDMRASANHTRTECLVGTPEYMAPELAETMATPGSDIYAIGILLYQMLTGSVPFKGSTPTSIYLKHINEQPLPPSLINAAIPYPIEQVVLHALAKDPEHRYKTVQALAQAYAQALVNTVVECQRQVAEANQMLSGMKLATPTQRIIKLSPVRRSRHNHLGIAVLVAAMCLFSLPFALGFWPFHNAATTAIGASMQFVSVTSVTGAPTTKPSIVQPSTQHHTAQLHYQTAAGQAYNISSGGQEQKWQGREHKYKHGHGHGHGHRD